MTTKSKSLLLLGFAMLWLLSACKKTEYVVIEDNQPPYHEGVTTIQIQNYVNKAYIDILGAEPELSERDAWVSDLKNNNLDSASRSAFILSLQADANYRNQFDDVYIAPILNGLYDSTSVVAMRDELIFFRSLAISNGDSALSQYWAYEIYKATELRDASWEYHSGQISINEYKRRMANNYGYDQINMGAENFVIACFENFLKRLPTDQEEIAGETMYDGQPARVFMRDGSTKGDFLDIMTTTTGFYEGLVIDTYLHLLLRMPNSIEMGWNTTALENGEIDIKVLQHNLAISEEYAGF
jgi:hypothetical protein